MSHTFAKKPVWPVSYTHLVRVPFADSGLTPIPDSVTDEAALFLGDILASGYFGAELCEIRPGDTVAVLGAGPVGLCAMMCAALFGAARIIGIEPLAYRRNIALTNGLADLMLDPTKENVKRAKRHKSKTWLGAFRQPTPNKKNSDGGYW